MSDKDDGGQAFPLPINQYGEMPRKNMGMTLRDYFAAQALAVFLDNTQLNPWHPGDYAEKAYACADAMLAERSK